MTIIKLELRNGSKTFTVETGLQGAGFYAKAGGIYDGGYRSERTAINSLKRKILKADARIPFAR